MSGRVRSVSPQTLSNYLAPGHDCGSITFDRAGRVISICISASGPKLYMFDPHTLATLASFSLPLRTAQDLASNPTSSRTSPRAATST